MRQNTEIAVLGGGVAGLSFASFVDRPAIVLERQDIVGGLSRSYDLNGIAYDMGPHIIFSKNKEILDLHTSMISTNRIHRSNQIFYKGRYVKYPFENDLAALDPAERDYCLKEFLSNPYETYKPANMLQFFLATFGEGITRTYLQPYNEKIWKFDPAFMDTQMVERIPKPPREDVIKSANGVATEGYTHQLYFHYPEKGGFQTLVNAYRDRAVGKGQAVNPGANVTSIRKDGDKWVVSTTCGEVTAKRIVNTMPLHELFKIITPPAEVRPHIDALKFNALYTVMVQVRKDRIGDHFAIYLPEKDIIFHRLSKLNFLGENYCLPDGASTLMAEVTFRPDSYLATLSREQILESVVDGLVKLSFIDREDVFATRVHREEYGYVIYDLDHRRNTDAVLGFLRSQGIDSVGRFAEFEYLNTDGVAERTLALAKKYNAAP